MTTAQQISLLEELENLRRAMISNVRRNPAGNTADLADVVTSSYNSAMMIAAEMLGDVIGRHSGE